MQVNGGWLDGSAIRRARKNYRCEYFRGKSAGGVCRKPILPGDFYVEGELGEPRTGPNGVFLTDKYCPHCAGPEALATIALIGM